MIPKNGRLSRITSHLLILGKYPKLQMLITFFVPFAAFILFLLFNPKGLEICQYGVTEWYTVVIIILILLYVIFKQRSSRKEKIIQDHLVNRFKNLLSELGSLAKMNNVPTVPQLTAKKKYVFFKIRLYNSLNWVDYFYLRLLNRLREDCGFQPVILLTDIEEAFSNRAIVPSPKEQSFRILERDLQIHLQDKYEIIRMSQLPRPIKLVGPTFVTATRKIINNLLDIYPKLPEAESLSKKNPSFKTWLDTIVLRSSNAIFWTLVIHELYSKAHCLLMCQWENLAKIYDFFAGDKSYVLQVDDLKFCGKNAKFGEPGKNFSIDFLESNQIDCRTIREWVCSAKSDHGLLPDLILLCRVLRGKGDLDRDYDNLRENRPFPPNKWSAFTRYFGEQYIDESSSNDETWLKCAYLLADEFEQIENRLRA